MSTPGHSFADVRIVGTGLLGTSIGLGLVELGIRVSLADLSPSALALAADYGAGKPASDSTGPVDLVIVATPPDVTAEVIAQELARYPNALVVDVASVKAGIREQLRERGSDLSRYIGTHPMAGRERGGPTAARVDLFTGRPWVVCAGEENSAEDCLRLRALILALGATPHELSPDEHDQAVAVISHLPQVVSSIMASQLIAAKPDYLELAGQGVRDVTRIAGSDPALWQQILDHNDTHVRSLLEAVRADLDALISALSDLEAPGARTHLAQALERGVTGVSRLPGKHGRNERFVSLTVIIDDRPGQLAQLLKDIGDLGVNLEDMRLEHSPGATVGFVEVWVVPEAVSTLTADLVAREWRIAGETS